MEDSKIIELFERRDETAISEAERKYGQRCRTVAFGILKALGDTDEKYIEECFTPKKRRKAKTIKFCAAAACLAVTAAGVLAAVTALNGGVGIFNKDSYPAAERDSIKGSGANSLYGSSEEPAEDNNCAALVPRWEERSITDKFGRISLNGGEYSAYPTVADSEIIGALIEKTVITGKDEGYTEKEYSQNAELYALRGIAREAAIAVKYEGGKNFYICRSYTYKASTLERLITDLGLEKNLKFTEARAYIRNNDKVTKEIKYSGWSTNKITELLLACKTAGSADETEAPGFSADLQINAEIGALGQAGAYIAISRDGYLETNILATGKLFFIGKTAAERFISYFENECETEALQTYAVFDESNGTSEAFTGNATADSSATSPYIP